MKFISAGLIIRVINTYIINDKLLDQCMETHEEAEHYDSEVSSVVAGVSDTACVHHVHVYLVRSIINYSTFLKTVSYGIMQSKLIIRILFQLNSISCSMCDMCNV